MKSERKPIIVISVNRDLDPEELALKHDAINRSGIKKDYYVMILNNTKTTKVQVFSTKNIRPIEIKKLELVFNTNNSNSLKKIETRKPEVK